MAKRYYEHEDRYSGKKFYSEDPYDSQGKGNVWPVTPTSVAMAAIMAIMVLIICPFVLRLAHHICFCDGFSWGSLIFYLILLAILYVIGRLGASLIEENVEEMGNTTVIVIIAYIISLIVLLVILPLVGLDFLVDILKWYDYVMSGAFALTLIK